MWGILKLDEMIFEYNQQNPNQDPPKKYKAGKNVLIIVLSLISVSSFTFIIFYIIEYKFTRDIAILSIEALINMIVYSKLWFGDKDEEGFLNDTFDTSSYPLKHVY